MSAAPKPVAAQGGAQIAQMVQTLTKQVEDLTAAMAKLSTDFAEGQKNTVGTLTSIEHRLSTLDVSCKAAAASKRAPKSVVVAGEAVDAPATAVGVAGEKFPSNSQIWLGNKYKRNPVEVKAKYFSDEQVAEANTTLAADKTYTELKPDDAKTQVEKDKLTSSKLIKEIRILWDVAKKDAALVKTIKDEWAREKSEFDAKNRTPAKRDD